VATGAGRDGTGGPALYRRTSSGLAGTLIPPPTNAASQAARYTRSVPAWEAVKARWRSG